MKNRTRKILNGIGTGMFIIALAFALGGLAHIIYMLFTIVTKEAIILSVFVAWVLVSYKLINL